MDNKEQPALDGTIEVVVALRRSQLRSAARARRAAQADRGRGGGGLGRACALLGRLRSLLGLLSITFLRSTSGIASGVSGTAGAYKKRVRTAATSA